MVAPPENNINHLVKTTAGVENENDELKLKIQQRFRNEFFVEEVTKILHNVSSRKFTKINK